MNLRHLSYALLCAALLISPLARAEPLVISQAWVREAPPTAKVLAAYMRIDNPGLSEQLITGASSPRFEQVEMHRTELVDGLARMLPQAQLAVPAGGSVILEPGGLHLMLIAPDAPLTQGETVTLRLQLSDGNCAWVEAEVKRGDLDAMDTGMDHSHHHH